LDNRSAAVTVDVSAPIVPFREAVSAERVGRGTASTAGKQYTLRVRAQKLPDAVAACVREHQHALCSSQQRGRSWLRADEHDEPTRLAIGAVRAAARAEGAGAEWEHVLPLGTAPLTDCANLLLCSADVLAGGGGGGGDAADATGDGGAAAGGGAGGGVGASAAPPRREQRPAVRRADEWRRLHSRSAHARAAGRRERRRRQRQRRRRRLVPRAEHMLAPPRRRC